MTPLAPDEDPMGVRYGTEAPSPAGLGPDPGSPAATRPTLLRLAPPTAPSLPLVYAAPPARRAEG